MQHEIVHRTTVIKQGTSVVRPVDSASKPLNQILIGSFTGQNKKLVRFNQKVKNSIVFNNLKNIILLLYYIIVPPVRRVDSQLNHCLQNRLLAALMPRSELIAIHYMNEVPALPQIPKIQTHITTTFQFPLTAIKTNDQQNGTTYDSKSHDEFLSL